MSVNNIVEENNYKSGPRMMNIKLKSSMDTYASTNQAKRSHNTLANKALKQRLDERQATLTKHLTETLNLEKNLESSIQRIVISAQNQ